MPSRANAFCFVLLSLLLSCAGEATFGPLENVPVARLIKKLEAQRDGNPKEAEGHYALARVHYLAFATKVAEFAVGEINGKASISGPTVDMRDHRGKPSWYDPKIDRSIPLRAYHAEQAVRGFEEAIERAPENALYWLGYASVLEEIWSLVMRNKDGLFSPEFRKIRVPSLREAYGKAFVLGKKLEGKLTSRVIGFEAGHILYEAARGVARLEKASTRALTDAEKLELQEAKETIAWFEKLPIVPGPVTPVVFTLRSTEGRLDEFLTPDHIVDFDLRGNGAKERWPWVKPELGFLVWDPVKAGNITSARQMFGNYTFQLFWRDGYHALSALDDNDDDRLDGAELEGISVWFDRDRDGKAAPEEVKPVGELGIVSIATRATGTDGPHLVAEEGLTFRNGVSVRSWDWMVEPVERHGAK